MSSLGVIYVIQKLYELSTEPLTVKIGSTKNFYNRMCGYKTGEKEFINKYLNIWKFEIIESKYNCYELDYLIRIISMKIEKPYKHYDGRGGREHYYFNNIENLKIFFDRIKVKFVFEKVDVDTLEKSLNVDDYDETVEIKPKKINIDENEILDINSELQKDVQQKLQPLDYQSELLIKMEKIQKPILKLIWSCGLGKSLLSIFVVEKFQYKIICIGVPSIYLQKQFSTEILKIFPNFNNILCIGGYQNFTTDLNVIRKHYEKHKNESEPIFIITTYSSCHLLVDDFEFDFKIGDEAHHLVGIENNDTKNYRMFHNIKSKKTLFMTATEKIIDNKKYQVMYSMDDESIFGECIDNKTVKWAIDNKKITDYSLLILSNTKKEIDTIISELNLKIDNHNLFLAVFMNLKAMCEYQKLTHSVIYCNSVESCDIINNYTNLLLEKKIFNIDEKTFYNNSLHTSKKINVNDEIEIFKNAQKGIISSVYILSEGFNLPKLNCVVFAEIMISEIRCVQASLRPNRLNFEDVNKKL